MRYVSKVTLTVLSTLVAANLLAGCPSGSCRYNKGCAPQPCCPTNNGPVYYVEDDFNQDCQQGYRQGGRPVYQGQPRGYQEYSYNPQYNQRAPQQYEGAYNQNNYNEFNQYPRDNYNDYSNGRDGYQYNRNNYQLRDRANYEVDSFRQDVNNYDRNYDRNNDRNYDNQRYNSSQQNYNANYSSSTLNTNDNTYNNDRLDNNYDSNSSNMNSNLRSNNVDGMNSNANSNTNYNSTTDVNRTNYNGSNASSNQLNR